jgi:hypothetical protein
MPLMSRYQFERAIPDDDADLRQILAATPMDGRISVGFRREPSWFAGAAVDGRFRQVIACRDQQTGRVIGFGCRSIRDVYINGRPGQVGYLSSLRLLPAHRNIGLVARGFAAFRELHDDGRVPYYLTTIATGNRTALNVLTSGRAGLPTYHPAGEYHTVAITLPRRRRRTKAITLSVRPASAQDLPAVLDLLATSGPRRQFFPRLTADDFLSPEGAMSGLSLDNVLLAEREGRLIGTFAGWDQSSYRQSVVHAYHGSLRWLRPFYNAWTLLTGQPGLPRPGTPFRYLMGAIPVVAGDDEDVFAAMLQALRQHAARSGANAHGGHWSHLLLGLHQSDPLLRVAQRLRAATYVTRLFLVSWPDADQARLALDGRVPYLEAGSL